MVHFYSPNKNVDVKTKKVFLYNSVKRVQIYLLTLKKDLFECLRYKENKAMTMEQVWRRKDEYKLKLHPFAAPFAFDLLTDISNQCCSCVKYSSRDKPEARMPRSSQAAFNSSVLNDSGPSHNMLWSSLRMSRIALLNWKRKYGSLPKAFKPKTKWKKKYILQ